MKNSFDDDIKAIFVRLPDDLELGKPPISEIEIEAFAQMLAPIGKLMKEEQPLTSIKVSDAVERLITMMKDSQPHIDDRVKCKRSEELVHVLESLKASIRKSESTNTTKDSP